MKKSTHSIGNSSKPRSISCFGHKLSELLRFLLQKTIYDQGLQQAKPSHPGRHRHGTTRTPSDGSSDWGVVPQAHKLPDAARANCASTDRRIDDRPKHRQPTQAHPKGSNTTSLTQRSWPRLSQRSHRQRSTTDSLQDISNLITHSVLSYSSRHP